MPGTELIGLNSAQDRAFAAEVPPALEMGERKPQPVRVQCSEYCDGGAWYAEVHAGWYVTQESEFMKASWTIC